MIQMNASLAPQPTLKSNKPNSTVSFQAASLSKLKIKAYKDINDAQVKEISKGIEKLLTDVYKAALSATLDLFDLENPGKNLIKNMNNASKSVLNQKTFVKGKLNKKMLNPGKVEISDIISLFDKKGTEKVKTGVKVLFNHNGEEKTLLLTEKSPNKFIFDIMDSKGKLSSDPAIKQFCMKYLKKDPAKGTPGFKLDSPGIIGFFKSIGVNGLSDGLNLKEFGKNMTMFSDMKDHVNETNEMVSKALDRIGY